MIHIAADLHLRPCIWKGHPEIKGDQYLAWAKLCRAVVKDPAGVLILAGDIFDTPYPSGETEFAFKKGMELLKENGKNCWFIAGNHDSEDIPRPVLFGAEPLEEPVDMLGLRVAGVPFTRSTSALHATIEAMPPIDILVLHTGFRHLLGFNETWQISAEDIPESIGMVFSGHVHVHSEEGKIYSPGSLALHRADELDKGHGWFTVDPDTKNVQWHEVRTRRFVSVDLKDEFPIESLSSLVVAEGPKTVVLLNYQNTDTSMADAVMDYYKDRLLFVCNARAAERAQVLEDGAADAFDPRSVASAYFAENLEDGDRELAEHLLASDDPAKIISDLVEGN